MYILYYIRIILFWNSWPAKYQIVLIDEMWSLTHKMKLALELCAPQIGQWIELLTYNSGHMSTETENAEIETVETKTPEIETAEAQIAETKEPETKDPETKEPETKAPEAEAAETKAPVVKAAETKALETKAPETKAPEIKAPNGKQVFCIFCKTNVPVAEFGEHEKSEEHQKIIKVMWS